MIVIFYHVLCFPELEFGAKPATGSNPLVCGCLHVSDIAERVWSHICDVSAFTVLHVKDRISELHQVNAPYFLLRLYVPDPHNPILV